MAKLEIALLGPIQVHLAGKLVTPLPIKRAEALLAYLAVEATTLHTRERLAFLFWPDQPKDLALKSLRQTLFVLRQTISPAYLLTTRLDVQFHQHADHHLDVATFRDLVALSPRHAHRWPDACPDCVARWQQAAALYRGDFLQHFVLPDSETFAEWVMIKREWLQREVLNVLLHLTEYYTQQADYEQARQYAWQQIELDPPREEAHRQLMQALARSGRRSEALEQYAICRRILADMVDAAPAVETTALYEQIRSGNFPDRMTRWQDDKMNLSVAQPVILSSSHLATLSPPHNLPAQLAPLIGRQQEQQELLHLLTDPAIRLLTLLGAGGIGKTHLALEVARHALTSPATTYTEQINPKSKILNLKFQFPDGVYFVELAPLSSPTALITAIAEAIKLPLNAGSNPQEQLCLYLRPQRLLLLLDNFEHLLKGAELVVALLQAAPGLKIMTTSRARLHLQSEQLFPLDGLDFPTDEQAAAATVATYGAVQLFLQQARRTQPHYAPTAADWPMIARICRLLEGMPLGILLAAAWLELYTPTEIARQIGQNLNFLAAQWQDIPARHKSMHAVFEQSWQLLAAEERATFAQLAVFRGGFTFAAAQCVAQATSRTLMALVDRSLVRHSGRAPAAGRFELHELVRQFAAEKLAEDAGAANTTRERHAAFFVAFLQEQYADMGKPQQAAALAAVDIEAENVRAAWEWAVTQGDVELLQKALPGVNHYYQKRHRIPEGKAALAFAAEKLDLMSKTAQAPPLTWLTLLATIWRHLSFYRWMQHDSTGAEELLQRSLLLLEALEVADQETRLDRALTLRELGRIASSRNRDAARQFFERSLALYQAANNHWGMVHLLAFLGDIAWNMGDYADARRWIEQGLILQQEVADQEPRASLFNLLGIVALHQSQLDEAEQAQRTAMAITQAIGQKLYHELFYLGYTMVWSGKFGEGRALLEQRIREDDGTGRRNQLAGAYERLGEACLHMGDYTVARTHVQTSLTILREVNDPRQWGNSCLTLAQVALVEGAYTEAQSLLGEAVQTLRSIGQRGALGWALAYLGYTTHALGNPDQAHHYWVEAIQIAMATGGCFPLLITLPALALRYLEQEEPTRAIELYTLALQHPFIANSRWFADVAGRHVIAAMTLLPPDVVQAAQERGRAADLWQVAKQYQ